MGKASRRKRYEGGGGGAAVAAVRSRPVAEPMALDGIFARWDLGLAVVAWLFWFLGHIPGIGGDLAIPMWLVTGFALGVLSPWMGLLVGVTTIPFLGGAIDQPSGEVLRNLPIHGAAIRVLLDRFVIGPALGKKIRQGPPAWVVVCAFVGAILYMVSVSTGATAVTGGQGSDPAFYASGIRWVIGGSAGMLSAWIAASHLIHGRERTFTNLVFVVLSVALSVALVAYATANGGTTGSGAIQSTFPVLSWFTFPGVVNGRLAALGYPTPTSMGIAVSLPFAVMGAWRFAGWIAARVPVRAGRTGQVLRAIPYGIPLALIAVALLVIGLTNSRGPVLAVGAGAAAAFLLGRASVPRAVLIPGGAIGAVGLAYGLWTRFGTLNPITMIQTLNNQSDSDRIATWGAAIQIALANPILGGGWRAIERFSDFATRQVAYSHNTILHGFAEGGLPLGITNGAAVLYSVWQVIAKRKTMAPWLIAAAVTFFVCGFWDIPQVRTFASTMGGIAMGMAAGPLIARSTSSDKEREQAAA